MRSWLVHLVVVALMALCAGSAVAGAQPGVSSGPAGWWQAAGDSLTSMPAEPGPPPLPIEPADAPVAPADPAPLDTAADVPALVDGPRPFPLPELQAAAPRRLMWAPPPRPFLEGLRRPPRSPALQG